MTNIYKVKRVVYFTLTAEDESKARELAAELDDGDYSNAGTGTVDVIKLSERQAAKVIKEGAIDN